MKLEFRSRLLGYFDIFELEDFGFECIVLKNNFIIEEFESLGDEKK